MIRGIVITVCVLMPAVFLAVLALFYVPVSFDPAAEGQLFTIPRGTSARAIAADLKAAGLVRSEYAAYLYFRFTDIPIKAGTYKLSPALPAKALCVYLQEGKQEYIKVTLPEGLTLSKTAAILEKNKVVAAADFLAAARSRGVLESYGIPAQSAEGFLFPDTYFFSYQETAERVLKLLIDNFFAKTAFIENFPQDSLERYHTVILASIIEREYRVPEEAVKIAGVFSNRLKIGMGLQSCATVEYILTEVQHKPHPERLLKKDLEINHPYNTYKWRGLPPGPISNPGITALYAACNPEKNNYFYFRLEDSGSGRHIFTKNLTDHARAGSLPVKRAAGY
ncbi:MAG: endolytic transglycosylase MltG [Treponema sp.]